MQKNTGVIPSMVNLLNHYQIPQINPIDYKITYISNIVIRSKLYHNEFLCKLLTYFF